MISSNTASSSNQFGCLSSDLRGIMLYEDILKGIIIPENQIQNKKDYEEKTFLSN